MHQELFDDSVSTLNRGQIFFANDYLDSTPGRALHIFAWAKVAKIIWSVPGPLVTFLYNALKIQGQGHRWGGHWKSRHGSNILTTHIPLIPCQSAIPFLRYGFFVNLTLKIQCQGHGWGESWKSQSECNIVSTHIPFVPCQSPLPFLRYSIFKIWPWNPRSRSNDHDVTQLQV